MAGRSALACGLIALGAGCLAQSAPPLPYAVDSKGQIVGLLAGDRVLIQARGTDVVSLQVSRSGVYPDPTFYYKSTDCSGTKYLQADDNLPPLGRVLLPERTVVAYPDNTRRSVQTILSSSYYRGGCRMGIDLTDFAVMPPLYFDLSQKNFTPPYTAVLR